MRRSSPPLFLVHLTCVLASTLAASGPAWAQPYTGTQMRLAVDPSIDIMRDHVNFLAQQDRYDAMLGYLVMTDRFAPLRYALDDGTKSSRFAHRAATMLGGGYGSPSKWGFMVGAWTDVISAGPEGKNATQGILFGGLALFGLQATYSYFVKERMEGVDPYGNFGAMKGGTSYLTYIPGGGIYEDKVEGSKDAFALYHTSGASLVVVRDTPATGDTKVSEVRAQLQPLDRWLGEKVGLPMVAVQKLREGRLTQGEIDNAAQLTTHANAEVSTPWDIEVGGDDLLGRGIRAHALVRVAPAVTLRRAELGAYEDIGNFTLAARATTFVRDSSPRLGVDAFARWSIIPPGKESLGFPVAAAASYSYDSPEASTFIPIPNAHVFGVQFILGAPDLAKPIVPIVRPREPRKGARE